MDVDVHTAQTDVVSTTASTGPNGVRSLQNRVVGQTIQQRHSARAVLVMRLQARGVQGTQCWGRWDRLYSWLVQGLSASGSLWTDG